SKEVLFESENLDSAKVSRQRIRNKVRNLTRFFLSAAAQSYDNAVRIVYLWSEAKHDAALELWREACRLERSRQGLEVLPFRLMFIPHRLFLDSIDPLSLDQYEPLPAGGSEPLPLLPNVAQAVPVPAAEPPAVSVAK